MYANASNMREQLRTLRSLRSPRFPRPRESYYVTVRDDGALGRGSALALSQLTCSVLPVRRQSSSSRRRVRPISDGGRLRREKFEVRSRSGEARRSTKKAIAYRVDHNSASNQGAARTSTFSLRTSNLTSREQ